jgi:LmbE family N-acetylglucosaminyl deacetylase
MEEYIFLSPHLDDAVLSCGAIIHELVQQHHTNVEIWTIFSGDIPPHPLSSFAAGLHQRWNTGMEAPRMRREEDELACGRLGVKSEYLMYPDCIYRLRQENGTPLIEKNEDLFSLRPSDESALINELAGKLKKLVPPDANLVLPLGIGNHIDHLVTRAAGEKLPNKIYFFADFPDSGDHPEKIQQTLPPSAHYHKFPVNNQALAAWQYAVEAYTSQISTFWSSMSAMYHAIESYSLSENGNCLWQAG